MISEVYLYHQRRNSPEVIGGFYWLGLRVDLPVLHIAPPGFHEGGFGGGHCEIVEIAGDGIEF